jgi:hypothetical protein
MPVRGIMMPVPVPVYDTCQGLGSVVVTSLATLSAAWLSSVPCGFLRLPLQW